MKNDLLIRFEELDGYADLLEQLQGERSQIPISLPRSARLPFMAALQQGVQKTFVIRHFQGRPAAGHVRGIQLLVEGWT